MRLFPQLKAKKLMPLFIALSPINASKKLRFRQTYAADSRLIAAKGSHSADAESLKGKHVGVLQAGSTQEAYANDNWRTKGVGCGGLPTVIFYLFRFNCRSGCRITG